jgi:hypothetical protein
LGALRFEIKGTIIHAIPKRSVSERTVQEGPAMNDHPQVSLPPVQLVTAK